MDPSSWYKESWESRILPIDCSDAVPSGITITDVAITIYDSQGNDKTSDMKEGTPTIAGTMVYVQIKGGEDGEIYKANIRLTLSNGEYAEDDIDIFVRD